MKAAVVLLIVLVSIVGCSKAQDGKSHTAYTISGIQELVLDKQELAQLEVISNGTDCRIEEYETGEYSSLSQYGFCSYIINTLNDTEVIIELKKFTNLHDRNGSYQYESLHLRSSKGLISENDYGDLSRFSVNSEDDYGGNLNTEPNVYYYHLWIAKDEYLIHITSKGSKEAQSYIANIGRKFMSKFKTI